jgi:hypothetical protein
VDIEGFPLVVRVSNMGGVLRWGTGWDEVGSGDGEGVSGEGVEEELEVAVDRVEGVGVAEDVCWVEGGDDDEFVGLVAEVAVVGGGVWVALEGEGLGETGFAEDQGIDGLHGRG